MGRVAAAEVDLRCPDTAGSERADRLNSDTRLVTLLDRAARVRRRHRWLAAVAAVVVAGAAAVGGMLVEHPAQVRAAPPVQWITAAAGTNLATSAGATVRYAPRGWGTELEVRVTGIPMGTTCQFWVASTRGREVAAGGWTVAHGQQDAWYPASVPFPVSSLRSFEVTAAGKTLVTVPVRLSPQGLPAPRAGMNMNRACFP
jgi:hypothetical protein